MCPESAELYLPNPKAMSLHLYYMQNEREVNHLCRRINAKYMNYDTKYDINNWFLLEISWNDEGKNSWHLENEILRWK